MNKNDKFHGITPPEYENNVNELSDDALDTVAGGSSELEMTCPYCGKLVNRYRAGIYHRSGKCAIDTQAANNASDVQNP